MEDKNKRVKKLTQKVDISNVPVFTEKAIKVKMNKKSKIGTKLNKYDKDTEVNYYEREKKIKRAETLGYYSLKSFTEVYKKQILVSYPYFFKYFTMYPSLLAYLVKENMIEVYENEDKNKTDKKTLKSYRVPVKQVKKLIKFVKNNFLSEYQRNVFIKKIN